MTIATEKIPSNIVTQNFDVLLGNIENRHITITKNNEDLAMLISVRELKEIARNILDGYFLEQVESGSMNIIEAIKAQSLIREGSKKADEQIRAGKYKEASHDFFLTVRKKALL